MLILSNNNVRQNQCQTIKIDAKKNQTDVLGINGCKERFESCLAFLKVVYHEKFFLKRLSILL